MFIQKSPLAISKPNKITGTAFTLKDTFSKFLKGPTPPPNPPPIPIPKKDIWGMNF